MKQNYKKDMRKLTKEEQKILHHKLGIAMRLIHQQRYSLTEIVNMVTPGLTLIEFAQLFEDYYGIRPGLLRVLLRG